VRFLLIFISPAKRNGDVYAALRCGIPITTVEFRHYQIEKEARMCFISAVNKWEFCHGSARAALLRK
jgi:hypothetical protein